MFRVLNEKASNLISSNCTSLWWTITKQRSLRSPCTVIFDLMTIKYYLLLWIYFVFETIRYCCNKMRFVDTIMFPLYLKIRLEFNPLHLRSINQMINLILYALKIYICIQKSGWIKHRNKTTNVFNTSEHRMGLENS